MDQLDLWTRTWRYTLTADEWRQAEDEARAAVRYSLANGLRQKAGQHGDDLLVHTTLGIAGEMAFSGMSGLPRYGMIVAGQWTRRPDFPGDLEVRTGAGARYRLAIQPDDYDDRRYVLIVRVDDRTLAARGWLYGREAKVPRFYRQLVPDRPPRYFVDQDELRSMADLRL